METAILINNRDRPTELSLLLQSIRTQIYQDFDVYILDDCSGTPLFNYHFFNCIVNRLKLEGHKVLIHRTPFVYGVSRARQEIVDLAMKGEYKYFVRVDDDCILEQNYLLELRKEINNFDIVSGLTIPTGPVFKRNTKFVEPIIGYCEFDNEGNLVYNGDDCGSDFIESKTIISPHFRSCAMIKREVHEKVKYYPTRLSKNGFREEQLFSFKAIIQGFKIAVNTAAKNYHLLTPSGGERDTMNMTQFNQNIFKEEVKKMFQENGDFLKEYYKKNNVNRQLNKLEYLKENNLI